MNKSRSSLYIFLLITFTGCFYPWVQVKEPYTSLKQKYSVDLPLGWMRINTDQYLSITQDGFSLQDIFILGRDLGEQKEEKRDSLYENIDPNMLPQDLAELILGRFSTDPSMLNFKLLENNPAQIDGQDGFRAVFTFKDSDGLKYENIYYGFIYDKWYYFLHYQATQRYYFEKDIETFENVVKSFKLKK